MSNPESNSTPSDTKLREPEVVQLGAKFLEQTDGDFEAAFILAIRSLVALGNVIAELTQKSLPRGRPNNRDERAEKLELVTKAIEQLGCSEFVFLREVAKAQLYKELGRKPNSHKVERLAKSLRQILYKTRKEAKNPS